MLEKSAQPRRQWTELIYPLLLSYYNKLVLSATGLTPKEASKQEKELDVYVNLKLKAKRSRKYPPLVVGDKVPIYTKRQPFGKSHVSVWFGASYKVEEIAHFHGVTFYITRNRHRPFLRHAFIESTSSTYMSSILSTSIALISSVVVVVIIKNLKCYCNDNA